MSRKDNALLPPCALMLGGSVPDILTGGDKTELLVGNAGDDTLKGGKGDDVEWRFAA